MPSVYYRFVRSENLQIEDFLSQGAMGRVMNRPGNQRAWDHGISVWNSLESAIARAREFRFSPGSYVVEISLPDDHGLEIEGPTGRLRAHYTIYDADPRYLMKHASQPIKIPGSP